MIGIFIDSAVLNMMFYDGICGLNVNQASI